MSLTPVAFSITHSLFFCWVARGCEMPKMVPELSPIEVKRLSHPGKGRNAMVAVGGVSGLHLQITPAGSRSWILRATVGARRRDIGLGAYPDVTLAQARERAREAKDKIWRGIDPIEERKATRAALAAAQKRGMTFAQAFAKYADAKLSGTGHRRRPDALEILGRAIRPAPDR